MSDQTRQSTATDDRDDRRPSPSRPEQPQFGPVAEFFIDLFGRLLMFVLSMATLIGILKVVDYFGLFDFTSKG